MVAVTGTGKAEMIALAARLKSADRALAKVLRADLRAAAAPVVAAARAAILSMPAHDERGLRAEIAASVSSSVSLAVRAGVTVTIVSTGTKMPPGKGRLPLLFDRPAFRHPVFGNREAWVSQTGKPAWFEGTIGAGQPVFAAGAQRAIDDTARYLEG